ncbi:MAG: phage regulatory protein/antirepressor Ant [Burkholderiaceae bacterium]|jgi:phage antirepressor YoqD-like protein|nr:phage regulatory protein/antirepressor Ant [Burkholderiaceae bacterium]
MTQATSLTLPIQMIEPAPFKEPLTMSSLDIADVVNLRHDNVRRTIETLVERGTITLPQIEEVSNPGPGPKTIKAYRVGKRDSYVIVAQLSPEFTAQLVDRWQQLEESADKPVVQLNDPAWLRSTLLGYTEKVLALEAKVKEQAPAVAALAAISAAPSDLTLTQATKPLGVKRDTLARHMVQIGWIYRQNGSWVPYQSAIRAGYLTYKEARYTDNTTGQECIKPYCHITQKGLAKLAEHFCAAEVA